MQINKTERITGPVYMSVGVVEKYIEKIIFSSILVLFKCMLVDIWFFFLKKKGEMYFFLERSKLRRHICSKSIEKTLPESLADDSGTFVLRRFSSEKFLKPADSSFK